MSDQRTDQAWERICDNIDEHIKEYFDDYGNDETNRELLDYLFTHPETFRLVCEAIGNDKLGEKIAQVVFDEMADQGPEREEYEDR